MFNTTTSTTSSEHSTVDSAVWLKVDSVSKTFGSEEVLSDISFEIRAGGFIGLVGQNGSGKTTLLRIILGLLKPTAGKAKNYGATIGYVPQRGQLYNGIVPMSVLEIVNLGSRGDLTIARESLRSVGMESFEKRNFNELSGGQQQRVVIAKALASGANVLILDEPTTGVDKASQAEFYSLLRGLHGEGRTIIMVSHDIDSVIRLVSRVVCLNRTIVYDGLPHGFDMQHHVRNDVTAHIHHGGSHV